MTNPIDLVDQQRLELTMSARESIIKELTNKGVVPSSTDDRMMLMAALDGLDRTVVQKSKLKIDAAGNDALSQSSDIIANLIMKRSTVLNTRSRDSDPILGDAYTVDNRVIGETDIGHTPVDYDTFAKQNGID